MTESDKRRFPWRALLVRIPQASLAIVAVVLMLRTDRFFTPGTLGSILTLASIVGVLAAGQAFVLIGGGFDLSQGATLGFTAACTAWVASLGYGPLPCTVVALGVGLILGAINGGFVAVARTNPFVTTLSTLLIYRGATFVLLGGTPISGVRTFETLNQGVTLGGTLVPFRGFVFLGIAGLAWLVLRQTVFGQYVYAVGGNAEAARLAGVRTIRIKVATFALSGLAAGVAAILLLSWVRVAKPDTGSNYELDSIAACVVGGVSLQGGGGSVLGAAAGCLLLQSLATLITMSGFPDEYRTLVTGAVILTFAAADALARRSERA
jgi:ribose transport system permease protein